MILDLCRSLEYPNNGADADVDLVRYLLDREPGFPKPHDFISTKDPTRTPNCIPSLRAVSLGGVHASADTFADQFSLELCDRREDVHQELARWVGLVSVEPLRGGDEANPEARQFPNPRDAVHQRPTETIELPDDDYVEFPPSRIRNQLI